MSKTQKALIVTVVSAILLHVNYDSGFIPQKDLWTIIEIMATFVGVELPELLAKKKSETTTNEG